MYNVDEHIRECDRLRKKYFGRVEAPDIAVKVGKGEQKGGGGGVRVRKRRSKTPPGLPKASPIEAVLVVKILGSS
jgi:hypothetical protein